MRGLVGFLVVAGLLGGGLVVSGVARGSAPATARPVASRAALAPATAPQLDDVDRALALARTSGKQVPVVLTFSEQVLQGTIASVFPQTVAGVTFSDPILRLPGPMIIEADASASIFRSRATIVGTPLVVAGHPSVRLDSVNLGAMPVPDQLRTVISDQLAAAIAAGLPPRLAISSIVIMNSALTVTGTALP